MPKVRAGYKQFATQLPIELIEGLEGLSNEMGRSIAEEVAHAIRRHLEHPPRVMTPALSEVKVMKRKKEK